MGNVTSNRRMYPDFSRSYRVTVYKITALALGAEVKKIEDKSYPDGHDETTIKFLKAAIHFLPMALDDGADLTNAVFLFAQAGKEFIVKAGRGDWEYYFSEENSNQITGKCVRKPWLRFFWDKVSSAVCRFGETLLSLGTSSIRALPGVF